MKSVDLSPARKLMQDDPESYEQYLLVAVDSDEDLYRQITPFLCVDNVSVYKPDVNNFESAVHYGLYLAIKTWHKKLDEANQPFARINEAGLATTLWMLSQAARPVVTEDAIDTYLQMWNTLRTTVTVADALATVVTTWKEWLSAQKTKQFAKSVLRLDGHDAANTTSAHVKELEAIKAAGQLDEFDTIQSMLESDDAMEVERFPMTPGIWATLNESLGGGFGRGEHSLIVAPSGGGKTVMACQIVAEMAYSGKNVLFVSTEEPLSRTWPRMLSAMSFNTDTRIPYQQVKGRPKYHTYLPPRPRKVADEIYRTITRHILYADWTGTKEERNNLPQKTYSIDAIDGEISRAFNHFARLGEKLDIVILDWLGATLQAGVAANEVRHVYAAAAKKMRDVAVAYDVATISMAQASGDAAKRAKLDHTCIAECRTLHFLAHVAIGISHLAAKGGDDGSTQSAYQENQCFNVFKTRGGRPMSFWMRENFDFMRFDKPISGFGT